VQHFVAEHRLTLATPASEIRPQIGAQQIQIQHTFIKYSFPVPENLCKLYWPPIMRSWWLLAMSRQVAVSVSEATQTPPNGRNFRPEETPTSYNDSMECRMPERKMNNVTAQWEKKE
jgi:hypothetical protein